jgi:hypothetical protein
MAGLTPRVSHSQLPLIYRLWFLYTEPVLAISGAYLVYFRPQEYLKMTHFAEPDLAIPASTTHIMNMLVSQFLCFGLMELFVTRSTNDLRVWNTLFCCMIVSDVAWIWAIHGLGGSTAYWYSPWMWDVEGWGNFGSSWIALLYRLAFVSGFGLQGSLQ